MNFIHTQYEHYLKQWSLILKLDLKYFLHGGFWILLSFVLTSIGGLLLSILFARLWPADVYGQYSFFISILGLIGLTALPGMSQAITQAAAENKDGNFIITIKIVLRWSLIGTTILLIGSAYFFIRNNFNLSLAVFIGALTFPIITATNYYVPFLNGKKEFKKAAIFGIIAQFTTLLATALALWKFSHFITVTIFSLGSSVLINTILCIFVLKKLTNDKKDEKIINLGKHLSFSQILTMSADYSDKLLIPLFLGFTNNAVYAFAIIIPTMFHNFFKSLTILSQPKIANMNQTLLKKDLLKKALLLEILILFFITTYIIISPYLYKHLYPNYYDSALNISQFFMLSLAYYPSNLFGLSLIKLRSTKRIYIINVIYMTVTLISLVILLPIFGLIGAVISKIISRTIYGFSQYFLFKYG